MPVEKGTLFTLFLALLVQDQSVSEKLPSRELLFAVDVGVAMRKPLFPVKRHPRTE